MIHVDWSENVELFQTVQEKSSYYTTVSASVNTAVLYECDDITSMGTISDSKSHKAEATMASLESMLEEVSFKECKHFYVVSDSPTSQYRNKKMAYLMKKWAIQNKVDASWIFTETGHGKGPPDGVGAAIKSVVKDTVAYHPEGVIRNTQQLLNYLPAMNVSLTTYSSEDIAKFMNVLPKPLRKLNIISKSLGIASIHEIHISCIDDNLLEWKKLSSDEAFSGARFSTKRLVKAKLKRKVVAVDEFDDNLAKDNNDEDEIPEDLQSPSDSEEEEESDLEASQERASPNNADLDLAVHDHVIVSYEKELFPGEIIEVNGDLFKISCMKKSSTPGSVWKWPADKDKDVHVYPRCDIWMKCTLKVMPGTARNVTFHVPELDRVWGKLA